ncbi:MAG: amylo-alpha-1,6-glucosidase [Chloroflexota bacterium]
MIEIGRNILNDLKLSTEHEWLVTNGIGGFAAGTLSGILTRRYHGLLVAALAPPLERTLLVSKFDEIATLHNQDYDLYTAQWGENRYTGYGHKHINRFFLDGSIPTWEFGIGDSILEKKIWMAQGKNMTFVQYRHLQGSAPLNLTLSSFVNYRDYHGATYSGNWKMDIQPLLEGSGIKIKAFHGATPIYIQTSKGQVLPRQIWFYSHYMARENFRGLSDREDHLLAGVIDVSLESGEDVLICLSTEPESELDGTFQLENRRAHDAALLSNAHGLRERAERWLSDVNSTHRFSPQGGILDKLDQLILSADQFVVSRPTSSDPDGKSVIAGYPWFGDWGRDTMISLSGLTLATGRADIASTILQTYGRFVDQGMLPNRFPDVGVRPEYNTVDATLWYFVALYEYYLETEDISLVRRLFPVLEEIVAWHQKGTRYNIHMTEDGLLFAGNYDVQLTWMDAKVDGWVVTPRTGKPVEINALWYNALRIMTLFGEKLGYDIDPFKSLADRVESGFSKFWHQTLNYCYDVIDGEDPPWQDAVLRPNQLIAVSLPFSPLTDEQQKEVVDQTARHLYTPHGLRSLSSDENAYQGKYAGGVLERDSAYHQGTVWAWLVGPFVCAHLKVYRDPERAMNYLIPLMTQMEGGCVGQVNEIFEGDPPYAARGCFAQAWSVAEILRAYAAIIKCNPGKDGSRGEV